MPGDATGPSPKRARLNSGSHNKDLISVEGITVNGITPTVEVEPLKIQEVCVKENLRLRDNTMCGVQASKKSEDSIPAKISVSTSNSRIKTPDKSCSTDKTDARTELIMGDVACNGHSTPPKEEHSLSPTVKMLKDDLRKNSGIVEATSHQPSTSKQSLESQKSSNKKPARPKRKRRRRQAKNEWESDDEAAKNAVKKLKVAHGIKNRKSNNKVRITQEDMMLRGPVIQCSGTSSHERIVNRAGHIPRHRTKKQDFALAADRLKQQHVPGGKEPVVWVCVLCGKSPHHSGLGDLFGPYTIDASNTKIVIPELVNEIPSPDRHKRSEHSTVMNITGNKVAKKSTKKLGPSSSGRVLESSDEEFWVHGGCIIWSHDVAWVPGKGPVGLQDAVHEASQKICSYCQQTGATLGCVKPGCSKQFHYLCARDQGCRLNEDDFTMTCVQHKVDRAATAMYRK